MSNSTKYKIIVTVTLCCFIIMLSLIGHIIDGSITIKKKSYSGVFLSRPLLKMHTDAVVTLDFHLFAN